ncbi:MAG TPA: putative quinol monooxygenase [Actinomycetota bacterium]|nr:putative quinol monooxygenase [Actinomycetota bacterium]
MSIAAGPEGGAAVTVFASFHARPGKGDELRDLLSWMVGNTRAEPGCLAYDLYRREGGDEVYHLLERYRSRQTLEAHRAAAYYAEYRRRVADLIEQPVEVKVLEPVDARG